MSEPIQAIDLARRIADALEDNQRTLEFWQDAVGTVTEVEITRRGVDLIADAISEALRNGGVRP